MNGLTELDLVSPKDPDSYLVFRTNNLLTWKLADFVTPDHKPRRRQGLTEASAR